MGVMDEKDIHGIVTIRDGKVMLLKNVSDLHAAVVGAGDPVTVLKSLADAGWKIDGDYDLRISKAG